MKYFSSYAIFASLLSASVMADPCQDSLFKLHDTVTSKTSIDTISAFSSIMLVTELNQNDMSTKMFSAYSSSKEYEALTESSQDAFIKTNVACNTKKASCLYKINDFYNGMNNPNNALGRAIAVNKLVKKLNDPKLFVASQKNLEKEETQYVNTVSKLFRAATQECK